MPKIKSLTAFSDNRVGRLATGDTAEVPPKIARELCDEKGYAERVSNPTPTETIDGVDFPKKFLEKSLPNGFPHLEILREQDIKTFKDLAQIRDYTTIKRIGENRAEEVLEGFKKVLQKVRE